MGREKGGTIAWHMATSLGGWGGRAGGEDQALLRLTWPINAESGRR